MVDHGGSRGDAQLRHFPQAYGPALGRLQKQLVKAREARADLGRAPHHDLEHLLLLEQGADLEAGKDGGDLPADIAWLEAMSFRSEEHTSELQSRLHLVCRLLLEKKKTT